MKSTQTNSSHRSTFTELLCQTQHMYIECTTTISTIRDSHLCPRNTCARAHGSTVGNDKPLPLLPNPPLPPPPPPLPAPMPLNAALAPPSASAAAPNPAPPEPALPMAEAGLERFQRYTHVSSDPDASQRPCGEKRTMFTPPCKVGNEQKSG